MACIRDVFSDSAPRSRATLIRDLATRLGYQRVGKRIEETLSNDVRTAVRRGILEPAGAGAFKQASKSIDGYAREHLVKMMLSDMSGWWDQNELIRATARYLGFRRTGKNIQQAFKSAINSAIRTGKLERDGKRLRKI